MEYYLFIENRLARRIALFKYEWLANGEWKEDKQLTLALEDALHDYGDYNIGDPDRITPEIAEELIQNGTVVMQGDIGFGTVYYEPKTIQISNSVYHSAKAQRKVSRCHNIAKPQIVSGIVNNGTSVQQKPSTNAKRH